MKEYKIIGGFLWKLESNGESIRIIKVKEGKVKGYAEMLVDDVIKNSRKIKVNLE